MAATATKKKNVELWNDLMVDDALFGNVVRNMFWAGFGVMVLARIVMAILTVSLYFSNSPGGRPASLDALVVFNMIDTFGALAFSGAFVVAGLVVSRLADWARITMLSVAALVLVGSNALAALFFSNLLN